MSRSVRVARTATQRGSIKIPKESVMVFPDGGVIPPWLFLSGLNQINLICLQIISVGGSLRFEQTI